MSVPHGSSAEEAASPGSPAGPVIPAGPVAPASPVVPAGPVIPAGPVVPASPVVLARPTRRALRTPPTPMRVDARRVIALGTAAWAAAALVLAGCWSWLTGHDHRVWLWTCVCGAVLGLLGLALMTRHHDQGRF